MNTIPIKNAQPQYFNALEKTKCQLTVSCAGEYTSLPADIPNKKPITTTIIAIF